MQKQSHNNNNRPIKNCTWLSRCVSQARTPNLGHPRAPPSRYKSVAGVLIPSLLFASRHATLLTTLSRLPAGTRLYATPVADKWLRFVCTVTCNLMFMSHCSAALHQAVYRPGFMAKSSAGPSPVLLRSI